MTHQNSIAGSGASMTQIKGKGLVMERGPLFSAYNRPGNV